MKEDKTIIEKEAKKELEKGKKEAEQLLNEPEKLEVILQSLENKLKVIPKLGDTLSIVPTMISLVRSYIKKEYTKIPMGTIISIICALIYILNPFDIVPDSIPGFGLVDDAAVIMVCLKLVESDIKAYEKWKKENKKELN